MSICSIFIKISKIRFNLLGFKVSNKALLFKVAVDVFILQKAFVTQRTV